VSDENVRSKNAAHADVQLPIGYSQARKLISELVRVDECKGIRDKAIAMKEYAIRAKDRELAADATEYRARSERRLGELMAAAPKNEGGRPWPQNNRGIENPSYSEQGIDKNLAKAARAAAALTEAQFERKIADLRKLAEALAASAKETIKVARAEEHQTKLKKRVERHKEIAEHAKFTAKLDLKEGRFALIYADPPWSFETYSEKGKDMTSPENHYPTMSYDAIANIEVDGYCVSEIAAKDAVCLMWCTSSNFLRAAAVMEVWGFEYKTNLTWDKDRPGTGYWLLNRHEHLLLGTRGSPPTPLKMVETVYCEKKTTHSTKPPGIRKLIEEMFPKLNEHGRIELFARGVVPDWSVWDLEALAVGDAA
jgi:N6-adenosine-specific RNA methylase IME4